MGGSGAAGPAETDAHLHGACAPTARPLAASLTKILCVGQTFVRLSGPVSPWLWSVPRSLGGMENWQEFRAGCHSEQPLPQRCEPRGTRWTRLWQREAGGRVPHPRGGVFAPFSSADTAPGAGVGKVNRTRGGHSLETPAGDELQTPPPGIAPRDRHTRSRAVRPVSLVLRRVKPVRGTEDATAKRKLTSPARRRARSVSRPPWGRRF